MIILFDTNVILDVLLDREPFSEPACRLLSFVERGDVKGMLCATTITTLYYLSAKVLDRKKAMAHIATLMTLFDIAPITRSVIEKALISPFTDFEDAVIDQAASQAGAQAIVTRDPKGFTGSDRPVYSPVELVNILESDG
jgi:predicted nucleic acid-binding protein